MADYATQTSSGKPARTGWMVMLRLSRFNVKVSLQRACPTCHNRRVIKWRNGKRSARYECSACGTNFLGAKVAGIRFAVG